MIGAAVRVVDVTRAATAAPAENAAAVAPCSAAHVQNQYARVEFVRQTKKYVTIVASKNRSSAKSASAVNRAGVSNAASAKTRWSISV